MLLLATRVHPKHNLPWYVHTCGVVCDLVWGGVRYAAAFGRLAHLCRLELPVLWSHRVRRLKLLTLPVA